MDRDIQLALQQSLNEFNRRGSSRELHNFILNIGKEGAERDSINRYVSINKFSTYYSIDNEVVLTRFGSIPNGNCFFYSLFVIMYRSNIERLKKFVESVTTLRDLRQKLTNSIVKPNLELIYSFFRLVVPIAFTYNINKTFEHNLEDYNRDKQDTTKIEEYEENMKSFIENEFIPRLEKDPERYGDESYPSGIHFLIFSYLFNINIVPVRFVDNGDHRTFHVEESGLEATEYSAVNVVYPRRGDLPYCFIVFVQNHFEPLNINGEFLTKENNFKNLLKTDFII